MDFLKGLESVSLLAIYMKYLIAYSGWHLQFYERRSYKFTTFFAYKKKYS